ncbi:hypothetical protein L5M28_01080 [Shewanella sp. SW32]|uniref:hypothetical protein n=1 Tax=unclassified Shewanella TaxID=196818 RepID=UPI0021D8353F|nr:MULTISPECIES: hypothetical protein [unclassified Shewanella]MCU7961187.1 hypothetical protein [Shewanella sp. SW32]MCU7969269.1 hypothetical protein [Shewanella sp. SW29]
MSSKLVFPMFTPVCERDGRNDGQQICFESYLMSAEQAKDKIKYFNGMYGETVIGMVLPFANRIKVSGFSKDPVFEATFLGLGTDYEEFENGAVPFSVAIYLKDDGQMGSAAVHCVQFISTIEDFSDDQQQHSA